MFKLKKKSWNINARLFFSIIEFITCAFSIYKIKQKKQWVEMHNASSINNL